MQPQIFEQFFIGNWQESRQVLLDIKAFDFGSLDDSIIVQEIYVFADRLIEFPEVALDAAWSQSNQEFLLLLDIDLVRRVLQSSSEQDMSGAVKELHGHLKSMCAASGGVSEMIAYTADELKDIIASSSQATSYDQDRLLYTLHEIEIGLDPQKYFPVLLPFLTSDAALIRKDFDTNDALVLTVMVRALWSNFYLLGNLDRFDVLENYLYKGVVVGIPVSYILKYHLYVNSEEHADYIRKHVDLIESIQENAEDVSVFDEGAVQSRKKLIDVVHNYESRVGVNEIVNGLAQREYAQTLYESIKGWGKYVAWLIEVFHIYFHLERISLLPNPLYRENTIVDKSMEDRDKLLSYVVNESRWGDLVAYYKRPSQLISISTVLSICFGSFDLEKEAAVDRFLKLAELLKSEGIVKEDIIEFHEADGKFHWNDKIV